MNLLVCLLLERNKVSEEYAKNFEHIYKFRNGGGLYWHLSLYKSIYLSWKAFQVFRQNKNFSGQLRCL